MKKLISTLLITLIAQPAFSALIVKNEPYGHISLRTGVYLEQNSSQFKGCVLFLQGLGDSIRNHDPLFLSLSRAGYRTITFDYLGQGGSEGSMNQTRVIDSRLSSQRSILYQATWAWNLFSHKTMNGHNCSTSKKRVIGWSTGGLAAYILAADQWADSVVLIAPGLHIKPFVGEASSNWLKMNGVSETITLETLTHVPYRGAQDPHKDPIKPNSPAKAPLFALNLLSSSIVAQKLNVPASVHGLVFLSGVNDTYVARNKTIETIKKNANHFEIVAYKNALHEIDNEIEPIAKHLRESTIDFLERH